jgi:hypothetical protein
LRTETALAAVCAGAVLLSACRQDMHDQPRMYPLRPSPVFADGRSARPLVQGVVARGNLREDRAFYSGKGPDNRPVDGYPFAITEQVLTRGQERFNIYCSPCHDRLGTGNGMIVQRGFRRPPSFHIDRLRQQPPGYIVDTITNGFGAMPDYAAQVQPHDRWAVAAYVKTLQYSQNAPVSDFTPEMRQKLPPPGAAAQPGTAGQGAPDAQGQGSAAAPQSNLPPPVTRIPAAEQPDRRER